jgi:DNA-binding XRE family transcriptional regulator
MQLVDALKKFRAMHRLTQKEAAARLGISREHYAKIESGKFFPSHGLTDQISRTLEVTITVVHAPNKRMVHTAEGLPEVLI